jgi:dephospho-CoA kinase
MMVVIGVTGGIGTGKSTVARMLGELGATVIDADQLAHEAMEPKRLAWRRIVQAYGDAVLNEDETISRKRLGALVFRDPQARRQLEAIVHPPVIRRIRQQLARLKRNRRVRVVALDVPLLVETGNQALVDAVVVVTAPPPVQRSRLIARGLSEGDVSAMTTAQWDLSAKVALADYVVDNSDGLEQTRRQVKQLWKQLAGTKHRRHG